jgi:SAM-dependent methyltransferase
MDQYRPDENEFTDQGLWTPQTFMLQAIRDWVRQAPLTARNALSIDRNPTLDAIVTRKWPGIAIQHAVWPEYDAQDLGRIGDGQFDLVYSHQVLEHLTRPWVAAREMVRVLRSGGLGIHTTCAFNPRHGQPSFNDYYRFLPEGLAALFEGVSVLVKEGWGNRQAIQHNVSVDDGHGALGGRRFPRSVGQLNDSLYPWHTWVIFLKN